MPYRGPEGFSWRTDKRRWRGTVGAFVLIAAGWSVGFFAGRMSAWIFPVIEQDTAVVSSTAQTGASPVVPASHAKHEPQPGPSSGEAAASTAADPNRVPKSGSRALVGGAGPDQSETSSAPSTEPDPGVALINPDWKDMRKSAAEPAAHSDRTSPAEDRDSSREADADGARNAQYDHTADDAAIARCDRRYSSFRASDGTYQPYGGGSRRLCRYLTEAYGQRR